MARETGPKCRRCRREGMKLYLKGARCFAVRCGFTRRPYAPGMQSFRKRKLSEYGTQLREKQKLKRYYGILERQFRRYFEMAERMKGNTGGNLLSILERRLDNIVERLGFAASKAQARQFINHGLIAVNGRKVDIPSYLCNVGDVVSAGKAENYQKRIASVLTETKSEKIGSWLEVSEKPLEGRIKAMPLRDEIPIEIREQLVVELLSK